MTISVHGNIIGVNCKLIRSIKSVYLLLNCGLDYVYAILYFYKYNQRNGV